MPPYLPWHEDLVVISGAFELVLGVLVLIPRTAPLAALGADRATWGDLPGQCPHGRPQRNCTPSFRLPPSGFASPSRVSSSCGHTGIPIVDPLQSWEGRRSQGFRARMAEGIQGDVEPAIPTNRLRSPATLDAPHNISRVGQPA